MPTARHRSAVSPIRCALRALADPNLVDGSGPEPARRGQDAAVMRRLVSVFACVRQG